jgi:hypothetical protein
VTCGASRDGPESIGHRAGADAKPRRVYRLLAR